MEKNKIKHFFEDIVIDQNDKNLFKKFTSHLYLTLDRKLNVPIMDIIFDVILCTCRILHTDNEQ